MATQKPISTISYNTESFLREKLDTWFNAHIIQAYQYICHKGEDGDKDHIHLRIEPNKKLDPMVLLEELREWQPGKDKPLGCRPFRPSKEEDWILYAVHDHQYLKLKYGGAEKGEKLPYTWEDIRVSDYYDMEIAFIRAKSHLEHTSVNMASQLRTGKRNAMDLILNGENPYTVNAIVRALSSSDYERVVSENALLQSEIYELNDRLQMVTNAICDYGLQLDIDDNGTLFLSPIVCPDPGSDPGSDPGLV